MLRAGAAPATAVVGAAPAAALSSDVGIVLAGREALTARAGAAAAWTRAKLGAATAVASPPSLTVARGRSRKWLRLLSGPGLPAPLVARRPYNLTLFYCMNVIQ
jgi:hypothetical protein